VTFPLVEISKQLYHFRWNEQEAYKLLKSQIEMENKQIATGLEKYCQNVNLAEPANRILQKESGQKEKSRGQHPGIQT